MNKVLLTGYVGSDGADLRYTPSGQAVANFRMATNKSWKGKDGERKQSTQWHRITVWGNRAEFCAKYLGKGRLVSVEGELSYGKYEKDGVTHYTTSITAYVVNPLGKRPGESETLPESSGDVSEEEMMDVPV